MSFRNRPVLDRKHRPRWQDELRTQRLIVAGFAAAIALAIGIFAATAWSDHYEEHLRPVAAVGGVTFDVDQLSARMDIIGAELQARYFDLESRLGGVRDPLIQQGQQAILDELAGSKLLTTGTESLVLGRVLDDAAPRYGISVADAQVSAELTRRQTLEERAKLSLIAIRALPEGAAAGSEPTDADWARVEDEINAILDDLQGGADFAAVATEKSVDSSAASGGSLGWAEATDPVYADYFDEAHTAAVGALVGPTKDDEGYHILRLEARQPKGPDARLRDLLSAAGVTDAGYRTYLRGELLRNAFNDHFKAAVMTRYQEQRKVAQIFIASVTGIPIPQQRIRHFLAKPLPGEEDQSGATDAEWAQALARAEAFRTEALMSDANWYELAADSDDSSGSRGGDLGWYDPTSSDPTSPDFVPEFKEAIATLSEGEVSESVKTQFGYHIIQFVAARIAPAGQVEVLAAALREDPDRFAELARNQSEDPTTAARDGEVGWVIRYQLDGERSDRIFELTTAGQISDSIETTGGWYIYRLLDTSPARFVPAAQLDQVRQAGFSRWVGEIRAGAGVWIDPQFGATTSAG